MAKKKKSKEIDYSERDKELAGHLLDLQKAVHTDCKYLSSAYKGKVAWKDRDRLLMKILESYDAMTDTILKMMVVKKRADEKA